MLYWMCKATECRPTDEQLENAIKRNFGGFKQLDTYKIFTDHLEMIQQSDADDVISLEKSVSMVILLVHILSCMAVYILYYLMFD